MAKRSGRRERENENKTEHREEVWIRETMVRRREGQLRAASGKCEY